MAQMISSTPEVGGGETSTYKRAECTDYCTTHPKEWEYLPKVGRVPFRNDRAKLVILTRLIRNLEWEHPWCIKSELNVSIPASARLLFAV